MRGVVADVERGPLSVHVDMPGRDEVPLRVERTPICDGERVVRDGIPDRAPHVDDAYAALEQAFGVLGSVVTYPGESCSVGLVDVHACLESSISHDSYLGGGR